MASPLLMFFLHFAAISLLPHMMFPSLVAAQVQSNITVGSSVRPQDQISWESPSGDFAVGFRPLESDSSLFLLAVWFVRVPDTAVLWAANRNNPVQASSKLELTNRRLVLSDAGGAEVWSSGDQVSGDVTHAALLDSGNFVLVRSGTSNYTWESFQVPTDTILPSQFLSLGSQLTSRLMESDYSDGRFQLRLNQTGNLSIYQFSPSCPSSTNCATYQAYWSTTNLVKRLIFNSIGNISFVSMNGTSGTLISAKSMYPLREFYHRATLDPDGVFRQYVCPRKNTAGGWTVAASVPSNICYQVEGSGVCGYNSYCISDGTTQRTKCACPPQYSLVDPARTYKGCKPDFAPQSCDVEGEHGASSSGFRIEKMPATDFPANDYEHLTPLSEGQCMDACLSNCYCALAIIREKNCWIKRLPLLGGRSMGDNNVTAFLKVPTNPDSNRAPPHTRKSRRTWFLLLGAGDCLLLAAVFLLTCCIHWKNVRGRGPPPWWSNLGGNLRPFTYKELHEATQGFKQELGKGAYGTVYKGLIKLNSTSVPVAVKHLQDFDDAVEKEFENEARIIAQIHHKNLVRLLGYCIEGPRRLLVYEYMSNGSLMNLLLGSSKPDWDTRVQLALGVARGLLYLHEGCDIQIIHCDVKPQNVLIDDNFNARITDFGLSKLMRVDQSMTLTDIRGTRGYVAPEWFRRLPVTTKVDVYSFGVLLLEIICCRRSVEAEAEEKKAVLTYWAYDCLRTGRLDKLVENEAGPLADMRWLERFVMAALWCIQDEPSLRPSMKKVIQMLEGAVEVAIPPDPSSYAASSSFGN